MLKDNEVIRATNILCNKLREVDGPVTDEATGIFYTETLLYLGTKDQFTKEVGRISGITYNKGWNEGFRFGLFIATATAIAFMLYLMHRTVL